MAKKSKNPYVHPDPDKGMLNQVGNDGYSFDERDDPEPEDEPVAKQPRRLPEVGFQIPSRAEQDYGSLSAERAKLLSDSEVSDMALAAQEDAQDRQMGF